MARQILIVVCILGSLSAGFAGGFQPDSQQIYLWDRQLTGVTKSARNQNLVLASHNQWCPTIPGTTFAVRTMDEFERFWKCERKVTPGATVMWERQWFAPHFGDVPERWCDRLRSERVIGRKAILALLDEQPTVEQWWTLSRLVPEHRGFLEKLVDGRLAPALHFWLRLRPAARRIAERQPPSLGSEADLMRDAGLPLGALDAKERAALSPLLRRYYVEQRQPGVPVPNDGDWASVPIGLRPKVTPNDPLYLYTPPDRSTGSRTLALRSYRIPPFVPGETKLPGLWVFPKAMEKWEVRFPTPGEKGEASGWNSGERTRLTVSGMGSEARISGKCLTRGLREVLTSLSRPLEVDLRTESALADRTVTLILPTGLTVENFKSAIATAFQAQWRRLPSDERETWQLELTAEARRRIEASEDFAFAQDPNALGNGTERKQLRDDLEDWLPAERRAELAKKAEDDSDATIRVSFSEFPPHLQRRLLDQASYEDSVSRRSGLRDDLRVDLSRPDDIQVSFRSRSGAASFGVFRLPLRGGGHLEY